MKKMSYIQSENIKAKNKKFQYLSSKLSTLAVKIIEGEELHPKDANAEIAVMNPVPRPNIINPLWKWDSIIEIDAKMGIWVGANVNTQQE